MSYDLFFSNSGDISFVENSKKNNDHFELEFCVAPTHIFHLDFNIENAEQSLTYTDELNLVFYVHSLEYNKKNRICVDDDYIRQGIRLRLDTDSNTVRGNESLGTNLRDFMHSNLNNSKLIKELEKEIAKSLKDILPDCTITINIMNTDYFNYHDSIQVVIKNNEKTYYYYL